MSHLFMRLFEEVRVMKMKVVFVVVTVAVFAGSTLAAPDEYRLAFITSTNPGATLSTIGEYNALVQSLADAAGIGGDVTWNVIGSTSEVDARDNTGTNPDVDGVGVPIYLVDMTTLVASNNADLWDGTIDHIIDQDENGATKAHWPFTGSYWDGTLSTGKPNTGGMGLDGTGEITQGNGSRTDQWIWRQWTSDPAATALPLYAMSEVIPEPATICLLGFGGLMLRRRRKA